MNNLSEPEPFISLDKLGISRTYNYVNMLILYLKIYSFIQTLYGIDSMGSLETACDIITYSYCDIMDYLVAFSL